MLNTMESDVVPRLLVSLNARGALWRTLRSRSLSALLEKWLISSRILSYDDDDGMMMMKMRHCTS